MDKIKKLINAHFSTYRSKLTTAFILTSMIPLLLSITIAIIIINSYLQKETVNQLVSDSSLEAQQLESKLEQIINMQNSLSSLFSSSLTPDNRYQSVSSLSLSRFESLRTNVTSLEYVNNVEKIRIYSDYFPFTTGDSFHFFPLEELDSDLLSRIISEPSGVNTLKYSVPKEASSSKIISFHKAIKNISGSVIAIYFIDVNLNNMLRGILSPDSGKPSVTLLQPDSRILYGSPESAVPENLRTTKLNKVSSSGSSKKHILKKSNYTDLYYLFESSESNTGAVNQALLAGYLLVFSLTVFLCIIAVIIFPNALSKRIKRFSDTINGITDEELVSPAAAEDRLETLLPRADAGDEIDSIIITFSNLFRKNTQLNTSVRQHELEIEKSKFRILQEQINPHFLYNSLDTIRICMLMDKKGTACSLIQSLSQFYRISLSRGKDIITIGQELQMIEAYLQIEQAGYDGRITWQITSGSQASAFGIPKFTLQPIVENAIVHGNFSSLSENLLIKIQVEYTDKITIHVSDNGPGITERRREELNRLLSSQELISTSGYGLQNCCQRIRLHYGPSYGLKINDCGCGTMITLLLPAIPI